MHSSSKLCVPKGIVPAAIALLGTAPITPLLTPSAIAQEVSPRDAVITSIRRQQVVLNIGSDHGAQRGAVYGAMRAGQPQVRLQITEVRAADSTAQILSTEPGFILAVGENVRFVETTPPVVASQPTAPAVTSPAVTAPANSGTVLPSQPAVPAVVTRPVTQPARVMPVSSAVPALASVDGANVTLNVGAQRGVKVGTTLPVVRDGNVVALVRVQSVNPAGANGTVIWRDETAPALVAGDAIGITLGAAPAVVEVKPGVTGAPMQFETGASNIGVPTADRDYLYLAGLAAQGLITSQPAHVFNDDGTRRHRTAEDFTFTRAQIAGFIREALSSPKAQNPSSKNRAALGTLVQEYGKELRQLGVSETALEPFTQQNGFTFGVSGQQRATLVGGDDLPAFALPVDVPGRPTGGLPFSERQGGLRTRNGFDTRTNIWARSGKFSFLSSVDAGTDPIRNINSRSFTVRRAVLSYDANKLLRGLTVEAGRDELWFGPGHFGTLLLGDTAGPLNMLRAKFKRGSYVAESVYAPLGTGPGGKKRSLYAKHTYLNLGSQARIGIVEAVLDQNQSINASQFIATFSPIPLALVQRIGSNENSNLNGQIYAEVSLARGLRTYGELLVDDLGATGNNRIRNRYGTLLGGHIFAPKNPTKLGAYAEYANLQGATYLDSVRADPDYDWYYRGSPLGYPVAPPNTGVPLAISRGLGGAESLRVEAYWRPTRKLRLTGGFEYADLNSELAAPLNNLSRQQIYRLRASYDLRRDITLTARAMRMNTSNPIFQPNNPAVKLNQDLFSLEIARAF